MLHDFGYWFERISLAKVLAQHPIIFLPALILFFAGAATYLVSGPSVRNVLAKFATGLLVAYLTYNLLVAAGVVIYLIYKNYV